MKAAILLSASVVAAAVFAAGGRALGTLTSFRTPSGNIGCISWTGSVAGEPRSGLRCDIRSGLRPKPARPKRCDLDYGDSYELLKTGRAVITCHGDTTLDPHAHVLAYGGTWYRDGFICTSKAAGLRCSNRSGHGFFLSRAHSYRF